MNGIQSMVLNMLGGPEGVHRMMRDMLGGIDPVAVVQQVKGSFDGIALRLAALEQRQLELIRFLESAAATARAADAGRALADPGGAQQRSRGNGVANRGA